MSDAITALATWRPRCPSSGWLATTPITAVGTLIGLIFTPPNQMPDALGAIGETLPSHGVVQVGQSVAVGNSLPASALVVLAAWTVGAGALAALAWRRVVTR
jgi:ABC-type multidrug transport system permease subunit